jgi:all-trans-8'-apo-beta-carotenal 15,15'-oxygenase
VMGMMVDHTEEGGGRSSLVVLDGADVAAGPVARVWLNHRIPHGLHGAFVPPPPPAGGWGAGPR